MDFHFEHYLTHVTIPKHRISLTKLRVSSHQLAIETGRYNKPASLPVEKRLCIHCGKIEDEEHFRIHFFDRITKIHSDHTTNE